MPYRIISSNEGVDLDVSVPTRDWAIALYEQDVRAGRSPLIVDLDGAELSLAEFQARQHTS
jgi:hypothetical protein